VAFYQDDTIYNALCVTGSITAIVLGTSEDSDEVYTIAELAISISIYLVAIKEIH
jgi:uncharacterized membrane protein YeiH